MLVIMCPRWNMIFISDNEKRELFLKAHPCVFWCEQMLWSVTMLIAAETFPKDSFCLISTARRSCLPGGSTVLRNKRDQSHSIKGKPVQGIYATSCAESKHNRSSKAECTSWQACNSFQPKEGIRPLKRKRGVCVKGAREEKKIVSWGKGGRKFTSGSSIVGHLKEQREEHKVGINALLMRTLMRLRITAILSRLLILYIYICIFFFQCGCMRALIITFGDNITQGRKPF